MDDSYKLTNPNSDSYLSESTAVKTIKNSQVIHLFPP